MSLINIATVENATGEVKKVYDEVQDTLGMVPNGFRTFSANPKALRAQWEAIKVVLGKDKEDRRLYGLVRYYMSDKNGCEYCVGFNTFALTNMCDVTENELSATLKDPSNAPLNEKNKALFLFAIKAVEDAHSVDANDINALKDLGASEMEIFDIVKSASHMFVVNTLFDTFKVEKD